MTNFPAYKVVRTDALIPYARNSRTHSDSQVAKIAASIKEFGFLNPIIVDGENGIVAGHGRVMAAERLGLEELPCIEASHLTDAQRRAYVIADNRLALDAGWDDEMLRIELGDLQSQDFDLSLTGFELSEIGSLLDLPEPESKSDDDNPYTQKVDAPLYEPTGEKPKIEDLYSDEKAMGLIEDIKNSSLPDDEKQFLMAAASRHIVFDFQNIAEFYAHASAECQALMEDSALVIVDINKAISMGYMKFSEKVDQIFVSEQ